jgi:outer membrane protein assembly factor BamB
MSYSVLATFLLSAFGFADAATGDGRAALATLPGEVAATARRLAAADKLASQKQWSEAVEEYQQILSDAGDDLVAISPRQTVAARRVCQSRIASLPPEQLAAYRNRVEAQAKKRFEQAVADRDGRLLQRVVDELLCSRYGDRAADMLGDWAFERGDFGAAERWWRLIVLPAGEDGAHAELNYPDTKLEVARIRAKQLLARHFQNGIKPAALDAYRSRHATAKGRLAGKQGLYVEVLEKVAAESTETQIEENSTWPTFGDGVGRGTPATGAKNRLMGMLFRPPPYRFSLETHERMEPNAAYKAPDRVMPNPVRNRAMAFHPVIVADHVIVADSHAIVAYSLKTGQPEGWFDAVRELEGADHKPGSKLPARPDLRYTLTTDGDFLYARLGTAELTAGGAADAKPSYLVCLDLKPAAHGQRLRWLAAPDEVPRGEVFEGAPLVHDGRVYIASVRVDGGQTITSIRCYPTACEGVGRTLWRRDVCITREFTGSAIRNRHHLLTLAGSRIVYCTHSGAIVALDEETGKNVWAMRYPGAGGTTLDPDNPDAAGWNGDLAPCVYAAGRIFAAPADDKRLLCLDPLTGAVLWEREGIDIVHLLGVACGRLVFTTPRAIRAVGYADGADIWQMPDVGTRIAPVGRGLLADDLVLWPTSQGLKVLHVDDGRPAADFPPAVLDEKLPFERLGNLVYADGCLAIAGLRELDVYLAPRRERPEREAQVRARPDSAEARLKLAEAQRDAGDIQSALESLRQAETKSGRESECRRVRNAMHLLLLESARRAEARHDCTESAHILEQASAAKFYAVRQAQAIAQLAAMWSRAGNWEQAVAAWQRILDDPSLRSSRVVDDNGLPQNAAVLAGIIIDRIVKAHGTGVYAKFEEAARNQLDGVRNDGPPALRELAARYPNAAVIRSALREEAAAVINQADAEVPQNGHKSAGLPLPLFRSWEASLDREAVLLISSQPAGSRILTVLPHKGGARLTLRNANTGRVCWNEALPFVPTWLADNLDYLIVGGTKGIARLHAVDGRFLWLLPSVDGFNSFQADGSRLVCLEGKGRLVSVDALTGEIQWERLAPAAGLGLPSPSGQFDPQFLLADNRILLQTGGERVWLLDAATGKTVKEWDGCRGSRSQRPLQLPGQDGKVCMALRPDRMSLLDLKKGEEEWHFDLPSRGTMTGELPQLACDRRSVFVIIRRNFGTALQRLNLADGHPQWREERLLTHERLEVGQIDFDQDAVYYFAGNMVHAQSLANGSKLWSRPVAAADGPCTIRRAGIYLLVGPLPKSPAGSRSDTLTLEILEPSTGQLLQRLNLSINALPKSDGSQLPRPAWSISAGGIIVAVQGKLARFAPASPIGE